jgi:hypothetical protein
MFIDNPTHDHERSNAMKRTTKELTDKEELDRWDSLRIQANYNPRKRQPEYKKGKQAFWKGEKRTKNPYLDGSLSSLLWNEGWEAAKKSDRTNPQIAKIAKKKH